MKANAPRREFLLAQQLKHLGRTATETLRKTVQAELSMRFGRFLQKLPVATEQTSRWTDIFIEKVLAQWTGGVSDDALSADNVLSSPEEEIALAAVEMRAESLHRKHIAELNTRLEYLRQSLHVPAHVEALAPSNLFRALQDTADALNWPRSQRRVLLMSFDETVVSGLRQLYQGVYSVLERVAADALQLRAEPAELSPPAPQAITPVTARVEPTMLRPHAATPQVDSATISMLLAQASNSSTTGYNDGSLAADLLSLASNDPLPDVSADQRWVPLQRMELAGNFLSESIADPLIPESLRSQHESVRFPLVKSALTDATFFTAVTHPLRSLVNELLLKSATSHITGNTETRRMAELLQQVLVQFDLAPDFVRAAMLTAEPIAEAQMQKFFEMQRQQSQQRRDTVVGEAKRLVIRELELSTFGCGVPPQALKFLNTAWGPLLVKRLIKHGAAQPEWKAGLATMHQLMDQLDARELAQPAPPEWIALTQNIRSELTVEGFAAERINEALATLEAARQARK